MPPVVIGPRWLSRHDESPTGAGQYGRYDTRLRDELPEELLKPLGNLRKSTFSRCLRCGGCWAGSPPRRSFQSIARTGPPDAPPQRAVSRARFDARAVVGRNLDTPSVAGRHLDVFEPPSVRKSPKKSHPSPGLFSPRNGRRFTSARCSNISAVSLNRLNYASYHPVRLPYRIRILIDIDGTRVIVLALTAHRPAVCQA